MCSLQCSGNSDFFNVLNLPAYSQNKQHVDVLNVSLNYVETKEDDADKKSDEHKNIRKQSR